MTLTNQIALALGAHLVLVMAAMCCVTWLGLRKVASVVAIVLATVATVALFLVVSTGYEGDDLVLCGMYVAGMSVVSVGAGATVAVALRWLYRRATDKGPTLFQRMMGYVPSDVDGDAWDVGNVDGSDS